MSDRDDIDRLAAEYVLGTLDHDERVEVSRRSETEPELRTAIADWEQRFAPLLSSVDERQPSTELLSGIMAKIDASGGHADAGLSADVIALKAARDAQTRRANLWRKAALSATAAAAALLLVVTYQFAASGLWRQDETFVAVFNPMDREPAFVLSVDFETREVTVRRVGAEPIDNGSYQLWIVSKPTLPAPRSMGLLSEGADPTRARLPDFDESVLRRATFGISREPPGGSPTGQPSPGALHGQLIPVNR